MAKHLLHPPSPAVLLFPVQLPPSQREEHSMHVPSEILLYCVVRQVISVEQRKMSRHIYISLYIVVKIVCLAIS